MSPHAKRGGVLLLSLVLSLLVGEARAASTTLPSVQSVAALAALATTQFQTVLVALPTPAIYQSSNTPCAPVPVSTQVRGSNGLCWLQTWVAPPMGVTNCLNITQYGGVGDGIVDNTAAFNLARAAGNCIYFPRGRYRFLSGVSYQFSADKQSLTILGDGAEVTELTWPSAVGRALTVTLVGQADTFHIRDLSMTTGTHLIDTGIYVNQTTSCSAVCASGTMMSDVSGVVMRSNEGVWEQNNGTPATNNAWATAIDVHNASWVTFDNVTVWGNTTGAVGGYATAVSSGQGITVVGDSATLLPVVFNFVNVSLNYLSNGILIGTNVQGVVVTGGSNFTGNWTGIGVPPGEVGLDQLAIMDSQFNDVNNVNIISVAPSLIVHHNTFILTSGAAMGIAYQVPSNMTVIDGNTFNAGGAGGPECIVLGSATTLDITPATVNNNSFAGCGVAVTLNAKTSGAKVGSGNVYSGVSNGVVNLGTGNVITGGPSAFATVTGAAGSGGITRLTVGSTTSFVTGEMVSISGVGGVPTADVVTTVNVVDGTHFDLPAVPWSGLLTYTSGGIVSTMP
jgi:hypothetical protein